MAKNNTGNSNRYGFLTMISLVVGILIGSGIFVKNEQLWNSEPSSILIIGAWIVASLLIIFVLIAFVEIASITSKKNQAGTIENWTRNLFSDSFGKYIGIFFTIIYYPLLITALTHFSSLYMVDGIATAVGQTPETLLNFEGSVFILYFIFSILFILFAFFLNSFSNKPGKVFQITGTFTKLIPLITIIIMGILTLFAVTDPAFSSETAGLGAIFDPNNVIYNGSLASGEVSGGKEITRVIILMLPAILFAFDGFVYSASLQNEVKKPKTYKISLIAGIIFVIAIYFFVTVFSFSISDPTNPDSFGNIPSLLSAYFGKEWIGLLMTFLILISILTTLSGIYISFIRNIPESSINNSVYDVRGEYLVRNKNQTPTNSSKKCLRIILSWLFVITVLDLIVIILNTDSAGLVASGQSSMFGWMSDLITVGSFTVYGILIIGIVINRFTKKSDTDKSLLLYPASLIAIPLIGAILVVFGKDVFGGLTFTLGLNPTPAMTLEFTESVVQLSLILIIIFTLIYSKKRTDTMIYKNALKNNYFVIQKVVRSYAYENMLSYEETLEILGWDHLSELKVKYENNVLSIKKKKKDKDDKVNLDVKDDDNISEYDKSEKGKKLMKINILPQINKGNKTKSKDELIKNISTVIEDQETINLNLIKFNLFKDRINTSLNKKTIEELKSVLKEYKIYYHYKESSKLELIEVLKSSTALYSLFPIWKLKRILISHDIAIKKNSTNEVVLEQMKKVNKYYASQTIFNLRKILDSRKVKYLKSYSKAELIYLIKLTLVI